MSDIVDFKEWIGQIPELGDRPWKVSFVESDGSDQYRLSEDGITVEICDMLATAPKEVLKEVIRSAIEGTYDDMGAFDYYLRGTDYSRRNLKTFMDR